jgi:hypothetical protein
VVAVENNQEKSFRQQIREKREELCEVVYEGSLIQARRPD